MKKLIRYGMAIGMLSIVAYIAIITPRESVHALITINDIEYKMKDFTLQEFMNNGFGLQMSVDKIHEEKFVPYALVESEANTAYMDGVPLYKVNGTGGQPINVSIYNSKNEATPIYERKINSISCDIPSLVKHGVTLEVVGLK